MIQVEFGHAFCFVALSTMDPYGLYFSCFDVVNICFFISYCIYEMVLLLNFNAQLRCACLVVPLLSREMRGA